MQHFLKHLRLFLILIVSLLLFLISCSKKEEESSSTSSPPCYTTTPSNKGSCLSNSTLTASTKVPLLLVRVQYNNACFSSDETTWANKMFGTSDGQMNHYLAETTYSKYQFTPASETSGCTNDGVITVDIPENHPNGVEMDNVWFLGLNSTGQNGFSQFGERQGSSSTNTWAATIGVMAHELGHAYFLLPDLYDTRLSPTNAGIGAFGLMGSGVWGRKSSIEKGGATPVHLSAWSKEKISACVPQTVDNGTNNITLPAVYKNIDNASSCGIYKATTSTSGEYFLFENRSSGGYDQGFNGLLLDNSSSYGVWSSYSGGAAIWHIKDILIACSDNNTCETQSPKLVDLEEANYGDLDNRSSIGRTTHLFYSGNNSTFDNSSTPNSKLYDNSSSGISATSISAAGDNMTLTISK